MSQNACCLVLLSKINIDVGPLNECWKPTSEQSTQSLLHGLYWIRTLATAAPCSLVVWSHWTGWTWLLQVRKYSKHWHSGEDFLFVCCWVFFMNSAQSFFFITAATRRGKRTNDAGHGVLFKKVWVNLLIPIKRNFTQWREATSTGNHCHLAILLLFFMILCEILLMKVEAFSAFFTSFC